MTFKIKLKTGFFRNQPYYLTIGPEQIILTPQENNEDGRLVISKAEIESICIIRKSFAAGELEIITASDIFIGSMADSLEEVSNVLAKEFGRKFIFQQGVP